MARLKKRDKAPAPVGNDDESLFDCGDLNRGIAGVTARMWEIFDAIHAGRTRCFDQGA
jgi:hypothetical protein